MSPRAAWLLERYGFTDVYDYVDGKAEWMAYGLPVEGDHGPLVGELAVEVPTTGPDERAADVVDRLPAAGADHAVVTVADGVVLGLLQRRALEEADGATPVSAIMAPAPTTVRPSVELDSLSDQDEPVLVTTPDGRLVGVVGRAPLHTGSDLERSLLETIEAVEAHFGDREVSEDDIRSFLRDRLMAEGKTPEEADRFVASIVEETPD